VRGRHDLAVEEGDQVSPIIKHGPSPESALRVAVPSVPAGWARSLQIGDSSVRRAIAERFPRVVSFGAIPHDVHVKAGVLLGQNGPDTFVDVRCELRTGITRRHMKRGTLERCATR
jgi:hypothetical protein